MVKHIIKYQFLYIPFITGFLFFFFFYTPLEWFPDYIGLSQTKDPTEVVQAIISVSSSILGILLALILIGFEMFRNRFGKIGIDRFFKNSSVIFIITFQLSVLIYSFIFLLIKRHTVDGAEITALYFLALLFLLSLILMFPMGKNILFESESYTRIEEECEKITPQNIANIIGYTQGIIDYKKEWSNIDSSPFLILRDLGVKYLREGNQHAPAFIIKESTKKFLPFITNNIDRRALREGYNALFIIWSGILNEAFKADGYLALKQVWSSIKEIHTHHADNKIELLRTQSLEDFFRDYVEQLFKNNQDEILIDGIHNIEYIYELHLTKSLPKEELLSDLNQMFDLGKEVFHNTSIEIQWHYVSQNIPNMLDLIIERGVYYKRERVVNYACTSYQQLISITKHTKVGKYQEYYIITSLYRTLLYLIKKAAEENVYDTFRTTEAVSSHIISDIISAKPPYLKLIVYSSIDYMKELYAIKKLDLRFPRKSFLGGQTRLLVQIHEDGDDIVEILDHVLKFIDWLKEQYEKDMKLNAENYLALYDIVDILIEFHKQTPKLDGFKPIPKEENKLSKKFIEKIEELKKKFKKLKDAKKVVNENEID
jgi:hypothetical protein